MKKAFLTVLSMAFLAVSVVGCCGKCPFSKKEETTTTTTVETESSSTEVK